MLQALGDCYHFLLIRVFKHKLLSEKILRTVYFIIEFLPIIVFLLRLANENYYDILEDVTNNKSAETILLTCGKRLRTQLTCTMVYSKSNPPIAAEISDMQYSTQLHDVCLAYCSI